MGNSKHLEFSIPDIEIKRNDNSQVMDTFTRVYFLAWISTPLTTIEDYRLRTLIVESAIVMMKEFPELFIIT